MTHTAAEDILEHSELKRSITVKQLYFYVVGDVLGSGIYVLVGLVAAAVGGAFWMAFLAGVAIALITGLAYAELVTKYPQAAGASLYINKAFRSPLLTFFITICMLSANMAAVGSLASGFVRYFSRLVGLSPESDLEGHHRGAGLRHDHHHHQPDRHHRVGRGERHHDLHRAHRPGDRDDHRHHRPGQGVNEPGVLLQFTAEGSPVIAVLAGVSLAFFAMTGFENAANVAEETLDPARAFPRALIGGMFTAGVVYVLVSISAALAVPIEALAGNTLLEVIGPTCSSSRPRSCWSSSR